MKSSVTRKLLPELVADAAALAEAKEPPGPRFDRKPLNWPELEALEPPEREWAINMWAGMGHLTYLAAPGGVGKSALLQQAGTAIAMGRSFIDQVPKSRTVLAWFAEDDPDELWRRQVRICAHFGIQLSDLDGRLIVESFADRDCTLVDADLSGRVITTPMLDELREQVRDYRAEVAILDNVARMFGGREVDRHQVTQFIAAVNGAASGAAVFLTGHNSRALGSEYSGSSAWENAARTRLYLSDRPPDAPPTPDDEEAPESNRRFLSRRKANYATRDCREFTLVDGVFRPIGQPEVTGGIVGALNAERDERIVLGAFRRLRELQQEPTDGDTSPNFLPRLILKFGFGEGRTKRDLATAMRSLMTQGTLRRGVVGKYPNRAPKYGLTDGE